MSEFVETLNSFSEKSNTVYIFLKKNLIKNLLLLFLIRNSRLNS